MPDPVTTFDARYSDPEATATGWDATRAALEAAELFWVSTVRPDGRPHVTPVVAVWAEDALWFSTGESEQKFANLAGNPQVVLTTGCNGWAGGLDVVVEGVAEHVTDDEVLRRIAPVFGRRWDGRWRWAARGGRFRDAEGDGRGDGAMAFAVRPVTVFAHDKGDPFGTTRHRFAPAGPQ